MLRFPLNDPVLFGLMLAVAEWGDRLPLALLRVAQWALGLELIAALVVGMVATALLRLAAPRGLLLGLLLALCAMVAVAFFGFMLASEFELLVLLPLALALFAPFAVAIWRDDAQAIRFLRMRALVVWGVMLGILLEPAALSPDLAFPVSPETRAALGYHPDDRFALQANVSMGLWFYGALSVVEMLRWAWWRLTRNWD